ncbi:MAG TPA: TIGR00266 family protein [Acidimicrobiales bacterium]|nr:TIGR00266 family protein [Acidimicrobiales bacterium]
MQIQIRHAPVFAVATVTLAPGESVRGEAGAMMTMANVDIETKAEGGFLKSLVRSAVGGESFFTNTFTAGPEGGVVQFVTSLPGDILDINLDGTMFVQSGSYLASAPQVQVDASWGGAKTFFAGEGLVLLNCRGTGELIVSSYGAIDQYQLEPGQRLSVDTGHVVAFEDTVQFATRRVGGLKSTLLSGEGLVVDLTGPGIVLLQTRSMSALEMWVRSVVPTQTSTS